MPTPIERTVSDEIQAYLQSAGFARSADSVKREYGRLAALLEAEIGRYRLTEISRAWLSDQRDRWAQSGHRAATMRLQVLKNSLEAALANGELESNLFVGLQRVNRPRSVPEQNIVWKDTEVANVIEYCCHTGAGGLARAVALGRWAGFRRQTICSLREDERYTIQFGDDPPVRRLQLRSKAGEVLADMLEDARLTDLIENNTYRCGDYIAFNKRGYLWNARQLNQALTRVLETLVRHSVVRPGLTLQGLRRSRAIELAQAGASEVQIMAQLTHDGSRPGNRSLAEMTRLADEAQRLVDEYLARGNPPASTSS